MTISEIRQKKQECIKDLKDYWVVVCGSIFATYYIYSFARSPQGNILDYIGLCLFSITSIFGILYIFLKLLQLAVTSWKYRKIYNKISKEIDAEYKKVFGKEKY